MKNTHCLKTLALFACMCASVCQAAASLKTAADYVAAAPFKMALPAEPVIPAHDFNLADYGAVADGQTLNTEAFAKAIAAVNAAGGGRLIVPQGVWLTGPIQLCSNLDLHLERGALVLFTPDRTQYPFLNDGVADKKSNYFVSPPIYGRNLKNIAITGSGIFEGSGETWRPLKKEKATEAQWKKFTTSGGVVENQSGGKPMWWPSVQARDGAGYLAKLREQKTPHDPKVLAPARDFMRPKMLVLDNCEKVLIEDVTIKNSPSFGIYPRYCRDLTIRRVSVLNEWWAQNGDGIDISACDRALVYECTVSCGDDGICMKSSGGKGNREDALLQNVVIAACTVYHAHGGFVIGSNTDGGMRNIFVADCTYIDTDVGIRVKSADDRGGLVRDVYIQDIAMHNIAGEAILFDSFYQDMPGAPSKERAPEFCNFHIKNVVCNGARSAITIRAGENSPTHDLHFENVTISADKGVYMRNAKNIDFKKVRVITTTVPAMDIANVENFEQHE